MKDFEKEAIKLLRSNNSGVLSTISKINKDYPFGSFVTYATLIDRSAFFYLSDIAEHTKNLNYKSTACLTIVGSSSEKNDKQNSKRLSLMGDLEKVDEKSVDKTKEAFFSLRPESKSYANFHGFNFYKLKINKARWIGGFGKIAWLDEINWKKNKVQWIDKEKDIIDHMNSDHSDTISAAINYVYGIKDKDAKIKHLTIDGYYAISNSKLLFIQTPEPCLTSEQYRKNLIILSKKHHKHKF